uniref:Uncharacterized protein n=1 Tax=Haptolina brevifila TaxID=156173 RepID=A0A7S2NAE2_9EUKA|mmetsp:Transcript_7148/g.14602  ORF Transcript_7148/g.14602 Transcript_7148/m.14602 type:complete len:123 (+) Transcript_7148:105-473(+)
MPSTNAASARFVARARWATATAARYSAADLLAACSSSCCSAALTIVGRSGFAGARAGRTLLPELEEQQRLAHPAEYHRSQHNLATLVNWVSTVCLMQQHAAVLRLDPVARFHLSEPNEAARK